MRKQLLALVVLSSSTALLGGCLTKPFGEDLKSTIANYCLGYQTAHGLYLQAVLAGLIPANIQSSVAIATAGIDQVCDDVGEITNPQEAIAELIKAAAAVNNALRFANVESPDDVASKARAL